MEHNVYNTGILRASKDFLKVYEDKGEEFFYQHLTKDRAMRAMLVDLYDIMVRYYNYESLEDKNIEEKLQLWSLAKEYFKTNKEAVSFCKAITGLAYYKDLKI